MNIRQVHRFDVFTINLKCGGKKYSTITEELNTVVHAVKKGFVLPVGTYDTITFLCVLIRTVMSI